MASYPSHDYFSFQLKNERYIGYRRNTSLIFILNSIAFAYISTQTVSHFQQIVLIVAVALLIIFALFCIFGKPIRKREYMVAYLLPAALWIKDIHFWPAGLIMVLLLVLNMLIETDTTTIVSDKGIEIKNYRSKQIRWNELENVVLKDGLLSIDFRNNKIFQAIVGEDYPELERSFNTFVQRKLEEVK